MKVSLIDTANGKLLDKMVAIPWIDKLHCRRSRMLRLKRILARPYWEACWWLYNHTGLFREIPEGTRFSWQYLKLLEVK